MTKATLDNNQASSGKLLEELSSVLKQFKLPDIDIAAIVDSRRKDIDALAAANDAALQGVQKLGHAQAQILKTTLGQLEALLQRTRRSRDDAANHLTTREALKQALQTALGDMRELAEAGYRAQSDTLAVVTRRVQENVQEFTALLQPNK